MTYDDSIDSEARYSAQFDLKYHPGSEYMFLYIDSEVLRKLGCLRSTAEVTGVNYAHKAAGKRNKATSTDPKSAGRSAHPSVGVSSDGGLTTVTDGRIPGNVRVSKSGSQIRHQRKVRYTHGVQPARCSCWRSGGAPFI